MTDDLREVWSRALDDVEIAAEVVLKAVRDPVPDGLTAPTNEQKQALEKADEAWTQASARAVTAFRALFDAEVRINKDGAAERIS